MNTQNYNNLRSIVRSYKMKKDEIFNKIDQLDKQKKGGERFFCSTNEAKISLYRELTDCTERKTFVEEEKKVVHSGEFEKYFRAAIFEFFLANKIDPQTL